MHMGVQVFVGYASVRKSDKKKSRRMRIPKLMYTLVYTHACKRAQCFSHYLSSGGMWLFADVDL